FVHCTAEQQTAMLTALDQARAPFFRQLKSMTSGIYYSTQIGYQELNKGGRVPASFGCKHGGHAWGGKAPAGAGPSRRNSVRNRVHRGRAVGSGGSARGRALD